MMRILLVNQSTDALFKSLCRRVTEAFPEAEVCLFAGNYEEDDEPTPPYRLLRSVKLRRTSAVGRFWSWTSFSLHVIAHVLFRHPDLVVATTNPPLVPWGLGLLPGKRRLLIMEYDIYPDVLDRMGLVRETGRMYKLLRWLSARSLRRADAVVTLGEDMAKRLRAQCGSASLRIDVFPNWADTAIYKPVSRNENPVAASEGIGEGFVLMYSGSFGATHDLKTLLDAADRLRDLPEFRLVLVGKGTRLREVEDEVEDRASPNVRFLPWQPLENVPHSLAMADSHLVTLDAPYAGISFPSKFYSSLAVGAAVVALAPIDTDLARTVEGERVGWVVAPGDAEGLASVVRRMVEKPEETSAIRQRARSLAEKQYGVKAGTDRYVVRIRELLGDRQESGESNT